LSIDNKAALVGGFVDSFVGQKRRLEEALKQQHDVVPHAAK